VSDVAERHAATARQARARARARRRIALIEIEIARDDLPDALASAGRLGEWDAQGWPWPPETRAAIAAAISALLGDWAAHVTRDDVDPVACATVPGESQEKI
jgi:hypothetical protein